jgi:hypothetical protein
MTPDNLKKELERLENFRAELRETVARNPREPVLGYGTAKHALTTVETEIVQMESALMKGEGEAKRRRRPRLPFG